MGQKKIRVAFVGCGRVAENHYKALMNCRSAELAAVSDINESLALKRALDWKTRFMPIEKLLCSEEIEAVFVLTPCHTHYEYVEKALTCGKHVLVEKPTSLDYHEVEKMAQLSEKNGRVCMPGHSYIYLPELQRMLKLIRNGEIGTPVSMSMSEIYLMPPDLIMKYNGPLQEVMCHQIYLMLAYMGIPRRVQAFAGCFRKNLISTDDEQVSVNMEFENGALAHLYVSWACEDETSDPWTFKLKILGTDGGLHFSRKDVVNGVAEGKAPWNYPLYDEMFEREVEYFINKCILQGEQPVSTIKDAVLAIRILDSIKSSIHNKRVEEINIY